MLKNICFKIISGFVLSVFWIGLGGISAVAKDAELSKDSTLEGILHRGELRIGLEVGYMPFEMIDQRSGLRQKELRHGGFRHNVDAGDQEPSSPRLPQTVDIDGNLQHPCCAGKQDFVPVL